MRVTKALPYFSRLTPRAPPHPLHSAMTGAFGSRGTIGDSAYVVRNGTGELQPPIVAKGLELPQGKLSRKIQYLRYVLEQCSQRD